MAVASLAELLAARGDRRLRAEDHQAVAGRDPLFSGRHPHRPIVFDPTERDSGKQPAELDERRL